MTCSPPDLPCRMGPLRLYTATIGAGPRRVHSSTSPARRLSLIVSEPALGAAATLSGREAADRSDILTPGFIREYPGTGAMFPRPQRIRYFFAARFAISAKISSIAPMSLRPACAPPVVSSGSESKSVRILSDMVLSAA